MGAKGIQQQVEDFLWQGGAETGRHPLPRSVVYVLRIVYRLTQDLGQGDLSLRATGLVYTTLLALVPALAVSFSVLKAFGVHEKLEPVLLGFLQPLGEQAEELTTRIVHFVENIHVGVLGSIGLALLLYTVVSLLQKIETAFNRVWRVRHSRSLARRFSDYLSVMLIGPVLVFVAIGITASVSSNAVVQQVLAIEPFGTLMVWAGKVMPYLLVVIAFVFVYLFIPNTRVKLRAAITGALVGGILWQTTGGFFASFIATSGRYTAIYSGFAILILFMIWLYLSWLILLLGAQVAFYAQHPELVRPYRPRRPTGARARELMGLEVMYRVVAAYERGGARWTRDTLLTALRLPADLLEETIDLLEERGLLVESGDEPSALFPARPPEQVALTELMEVLRDGEVTQPPDPAVMAVSDRMEAGMREAVAGMTLQDLAPPPERE